MLINDKKTIKEVQEEFHKKFPYLKLEFYKGKHQDGEPSEPSQQLDENLSIAQARKTHKEGELSIDGHLKVSTLEQNFWDFYGLNVQVFRRSGNLWLQTTKTDHWTLSEQNGKGQRSEDSFQDMHK